MIPTAARALASVWRLNTLRIAKRAFAATPKGTIAERALFGHVMPIDIGRSENHKLLYLEGERYIPERPLIEPLVRPGMRVVDAGANIGYYLLFFRSLVGEAGHITAVEPVPGNVRDLERVRGRNGFANVAIEPVALGRERGTVQMWEDVNGICTVGGALSVPQTPLDDLVEQADFIKIDVEGFEGHVLHGAQRILREHHPILFLEIHPSMIKDYTVADVLAQLQASYSVHCFRIDYLDTRAKLRAKYRGVVPFREMHVREVALACQRGELTAPFWAICN